ncbi:hypothetical protein [Absidia glauca]|uniref:Large ribosomal subunit protein uL10 n=1 Tax=Absidia glauca TaxID=4829 RepID=A0A168SER6_ABSGL|nr:hypothetical protein [Absidia glauca]
MSKREAKENYFLRLKEYLDTYSSIFIVNVDNVSSNQMHQIRHSLRGEGVVLMGKNTMVRRALKTFVAERPEFERLLPHVKGNIGFVFTNNDLKEIREKILSNRVAAPARANAVAPSDVVVPGGNTGMEPGKTSFFQALGIPTKISRGSTFSSEVLDVGEEQLVANLLAAIRQVAAVSLAVGYPTLASVPHSLINGYKNLLAVSVASDYTFAGSEQIKEYLENPEAFAVAAPVAAAGADAGAAQEAAPAEEEESEDDDMGFGLFD